MSQDPEVVSGAIVFAGTRVPLTHLFEFVGSKADIEEFLQSFPSVSRVQVNAVLKQLQISFPASETELPHEDSARRVDTGSASQTVS